MAYFESPCKKSVLNKNDAASMPTLVESTYQKSYIAPKITIKNILKVAVEKSLPPDYLPKASGKRLLPTNFLDFYQNCISISIGEKLKLEFTDDTPDWKMSGRKEAADNWIKESIKKRKKLA